MERKERINALAEQLKNFFLIFDATFLTEEDTEQLLQETRESLKEKISFNNSALPVIMAMGGNYNSDIDTAKVEEISALLNLVRARKKLRDETLAEMEHTSSMNEALKMFGL